MPKEKKWILIEISKCFFLVSKRYLPQFSLSPVFFILLHTTFKIVILSSFLNKFFISYKRMQFQMEQLHVGCARKRCWHFCLSRLTVTQDSLANCRRPENRSLDRWENSCRSLLWRIVNPSELLRWRCSGRPAGASGRWKTQEFTKNAFSKLQVARVKTKENANSKEKRLTYS